jgi:hypothetical protein
METSVQRIQRAKSNQDNVDACRPRPGVHVLVQCNGFRCLAYLDEKGVWRDAHHREELKVLRIISS